VPAVAAVAVVAAIAVVVASKSPAVAVAVAVSVVAVVAVVVVVVAVTWAPGLMVVAEGWEREALGSAAGQVLRSRELWLRLEEAKAL
jgi:hypothetical protein